MKHLIRQRPLKGGRIRGGFGFAPHINTEVRRIAARYVVSVPFLLSAIAAGWVGIELEKEDQLPWPKRKVSG